MVFMLGAAGLPNQTSCDNCPLYRFKEEECSDGLRPGTCGHKPTVKKPLIYSGDNSTVTAEQLKGRPIPPVVYKNVDAESPLVKGVVERVLKMREDDKSLIKNCQPDNNEIEVSRIFITHWNPRTNFDDDGLKELAKDIEKNSLLQPILIRPKGEKSYELVIGERRLRAFRDILRRKTIPANVREMTDKQVVLAMLSENLQRKDLNPIEEANGLKRCLEISKLSQTELANQIGKSQEWVSNRIRLLEAPQELQGMIICCQINPTHVLELLTVKDAPQFDKIMSLVRQGVKEDSGKFTVSNLKNIIKDLTKPDNGNDISLNMICQPDNTLDKKFSPVVEALITEATESSKALNEPEPQPIRTTQKGSVCPTCGGKGWV